MSRFLRKRSNSAMSGVSSRPPIQVHHPERVSTPEQEALQVRREVYLNHWKQIQAIINKVFTNRRAFSKVSTDDVQTVSNYALQLMHLLVEEEAPSQGMIGRLLEVTIQEKILERLYIWCERAGDHREDAKRELLRIYELLIGQCRQSVLTYPAILNPLLRLLLACWEYASPDSELQLIALLQQLCISLSQDPNLLEFLFHESPTKGPAKFLLFSLLIPYIHREGVMGQQARDALLLCISVSAEAKQIGKYIAESTNLCPVLAGGLGALYSSLPRKLDISPDHWHRITQEDLATMPDLVMFLNSLEFCNAVVQVAHPLISNQLVQYFYDGFLVPVIGPALHQLDREAILLRSDKYRPFSQSDAMQNTTDLNQNEEIVSATAYVEIFLRSISDPRLMRAFLRYLCLGWYDNTTVLESLIRRIGTNSKLCVVTLSLFDTLLNINCEDVMIELILKYLVPCTHVMASQRKAIRDLDIYGKWAEKFLSLSPDCCKPCKDSQEKSNQGSKPDLSQRSQTPSVVGENAWTANGMLDVVRLTSKDHVTITGSNQSLTNGFPLDGDVLQQSDQGRITPDPQMARSTSGNSDSDTLSQASRMSLEEPVCEIDSRHIEYLLDARCAIVQCCKSCKHWSAPYDGHLPAPTVLSADIESAQPSMEERFKFRSTSRYSESAQSPDREPISCIKQNGEIAGCDDAQKTANRSYDHEKDEALAGMLSSTIEEVLNISIGDSSAKVEDDDDEVTLAEVFQGEELSLLELVDNVDMDRSSQEETESSEIEDSSQGDSDEKTRIKLLKHSYNRQSGSRYDHDMSDDSRVSSKSQSRQNSLFEHDEPGVFWQFDSDLDMTPHRRFSSVGGQFFDDSFETSYHLNESSDFCHSSSFNRSGFLDGEFPNSFYTNGTRSLASPLSFDGADENHFTLSEAELSPQSGTSSRGSSPLHEGDSSKGSASPTRMGQISNGALPRPAGLMLESVGYHSSFNPVGKITGAPTIGPFMSTIFTKLESMMENSLYVNLLLTGIISRLACYPQPLLRSFLLNTNMVFQPTVRSLLQVLTSVRSRLDAYATKTEKWEFLLHRSKEYLMMRESDDGIDQLRDRSWSVMEDRDQTVVKSRSNTLTLRKQASRRASLTDMFLKRRIRSVKNSEKQKLSAIREAGMGGDKPGESTALYESLKARNAVYCAVVLDEFVKELAALSQEHAVLSLENL